MISPIISRVLAFCVSPIAVAEDTPDSSITVADDATTVPTLQADAFPEIETDTLLTTESTAPVDWFPSMPRALETDPTAVVEETPDMDTETDKPTDPTLPVPTTPSSCSDTLTNTVPTAVVDALPVNAIDVAPRLTEPTAAVDALPVTDAEIPSATLPTAVVEALPVMA
jgi:hypothetical protein